MVLSLGQGGQQTIDAIAFNIDPKEWPNNALEKVSLVYQLSVNIFRGVESAQLLVRHIEPLR